MADLLALAEHAGVDARILVDRDGTVAAVRRRNQPQPAAFLGAGNGLLLVAGLEPLAVGQQPDLQEMDRLSERDGLNSLCSTPVPADMRCTSPGRITEPVPIESLCSSAPSST
jgi:hypothetical protein